MLALSLISLRGDIFRRRGEVATRVRVKGCFARSQTGPNRRPAHLIADACALWVTDRPVRLAVLTECGQALLRVTSYLHAPDEYELCDACLLADYQPPVVYRFLDANGEPVYIGQSTDLLARLDNHARQSRWWPDVTRCEFDAYPSATDLSAAEAAAIRAERPRFNVLFNTDRAGA
jgi:hypothetical protein